MMISGNKSLAVVKATAKRTNDTYKVGESSVGICKGAARVAVLSGIAIIPCVVVFLFTGIGNGLVVAERVSIGLFVVCTSKYPSGPFLEVVERFCDSCMGDECGYTSKTV